MPRVVFDTVIFVRCLLNPRSIWGRLVFQLGHRYRLILSEPILVEILEVIRRPEIASKFRRLDGLGIEGVLEILADAEIVDLTEIPPVSRDPEDDKFLATALASHARYLVTEDGDLLDLREYQGIQIVSGATFLRVLYQGPTE